MTSWQRRSRPFPGLRPRSPTLSLRNQLALSQVDGPPLDAAAWRSPPIGSRGPSHRPCRQRVLIGCVPDRADGGSSVDGPGQRAPLAGREKAGVRSSCAQALQMPIRTGFDRQDPGHLRQSRDLMKALVPAPPSLLLICSQIPSTGDGAGMGILKRFPGAFRGPGRRTPRQHRRRGAQPRRRLHGCKCRDSRQRTCEVAASHVTQT